MRNTKLLDHAGIVKKGDLVRNAENDQVRTLLMPTSHRFGMLASKLESSVPSLCGLEARFDIGTGDDVQVTGPRPSNLFGVNLSTEHENSIQARTRKATLNQIFLEVRVGFEPT